MSESVDILLVDDTPANLLALEALLSKLGNIVKARSGKEALKTLLKQDFAVILLDINMPGMDGFETASLIRQRKNSELTPIIFITAYGSSEMHRNLSYSLGAVDYIFSPVVPEILQSKVSVFVELHKKTLQIKRLNDDLRAHAKSLEQRVKERTSELVNANEELKKEIREHQQTERQLQKANKELVELYQIKSEFTSMVSHELRTPLAAIKEGIELVLDGVDGPVTQNQASTLNISRSNVDRLAKLIQNVLDFSKLESGKMEILFDDTDLNALLTEVYELMNPIASKKSLHFSLRLPKETVHAMCDGDKIKQLVINLVDNAIKFTEGNGKIMVRLFQKDESVFVEVEDSGVGIHEDDCGKIFEMFAQISHRKNRKTGGVGIGLAVCRQIAEQHYGTLSVESVLGKGSKFLLNFPASLSPTMHSRVDFSVFPS